MKNKVQKGISGLLPAVYFVFEGGGMIPLSLGRVCIHYTHHLREYLHVVGRQHKGYVKRVQRNVFGDEHTRTRMHTHEHTNA